MTPIDLDSLERLLAEGTEGKWRHERDVDPKYEDGLSDGVVMSQWHTLFRPGARAPEQAIADARLIAALHNAAPELLRIARAVKEMGHARRNPKLSRHAISEIEKRVVDIAYELSAPSDSLAAGEGAR